MYKYIFLFIALLSLSTVNIVYAGEEDDDQSSFVEITNNDSQAVDAEDTDTDTEQDAPLTGGYGAEKLDIVCRNSQPTPVVKFLAQVVFQGVDEDKIEVSNFVARCNVDSNLAEAKIEILVHKEWWRTLRDVISGKEANTTLNKEANCKVTDKALTFYLKDDAKEIEVICGNPQVDNASSGGGGYGGGNYGGGGYGGSGQQPQQPPYQQPQQPQQPPAYGGGQQYPYDPYDNGWQDYSSGWNDFTDETDGVFADDFTSESDWLDDGWDDGWGSGDSTDVMGEPSDGSGLYGSVTGDIVDFGTVDNSNDDDLYYAEESLYTEYTDQDPIGLLLQDAPRVVQDPYDEWGVLDSQYTDMSAQGLANFGTYTEFKQYYTGEVSEQEWEDWRSWMFNRNASNFEFEVGFYDTTDSEPDYAWYNPYKWWMALNGWLTEVNPVGGSNRKYDI